MLWIGNSYTSVNNLPQVFYNLSLSGGDSVMFDSNALGGYTFQNHSANATTIQKITIAEMELCCVAGTEPRTLISTNASTIANYAVCAFVG